ncbi:hypothetical protein CHS0354_035981 [Potamilus streckersoni]|uniref:G-protein coupled receptors family 1 profile domain-containing protein n=1 Tax=Potamilus streckersoni TaxID=2493646 RepID=A0AAE0SBY2_9BIVA|nr:hypothetical protein CHS0354_035981 [Potamilus streckersoni]
MRMESMDNNVSISAQDDKAFQLEDLNDEKMLENIGGIIFVSFLMIVGFGGNSTAIFVYLRKYRPSTHRTFIISLAIVDLATCCVPMPFILVTLRYPIMFQNNGGCKLLQFVTYAMCVGSSMILLTIAGERYRKICVPHGKQLSERKSKYICVLGILLGILLSWPAAVMYGNRTFKTGFDHIVGTECNVNDDFADTKYPAYFNIFLIFVVFATLIALSVVYAFIGKQIFRMKKIMSPKIQTNFSETDSATKTQTTEFSCSQQSQKEDTTKGGIFQKFCDDRSNIPVKSLSVASVSKNHVLMELNTKTQDNEKNQSRTVAITRVLFIITVVYFCSYLPHLALRTAAFLNKNLLPNLSFAGMLAYQTFRWTFFINNMANPIIYGLYDRKFMKEVRKLCRSCLAICFKQNQRRDFDLT